MLVAIVAISVVGAELGDTSSFDCPYAAPASNANLLALSRREIASASMPFVVWSCRS